MDNKTRFKLGAVGAAATIVVLGVALAFVPIEPGLTYLEKGKVVAALSKQLNDPYSAQFTFRGWARDPKLDAQGHVIPLDKEAWAAGRVSKVEQLPPTWYCGFVNAKNSFGAYTGNQYFAANPWTGEAFVGEDEISAARRNGRLSFEVNDWCLDELVDRRDGKKVWRSGFDPSIIRPIHY